MAKEKDTFQDTLNGVKEEKLKKNIQEFRGALRRDLKELKDKKVDFEMCLNHIEYTARVLINDVNELRLRKEKI